MRKIIKICLIALVLLSLTACEISDMLVKTKYKELEALLIPLTDHGEIDFNNMDINDHQYIAYCLKAVVRMRENKNMINSLVEYLIEHSDDNNDGEIGWGLGYEWKAFGENNSKWHVYAIETINVMDAYLDALDSGYLSKDLQEIVKKQLYDLAIIWNQKYWSEKGDLGDKYFYWYSISKSDAVACLNIDAKMVGTQARLLQQYGELFTEDEKQLIYNHLDQTYSKIMQEKFLFNGDIVWNYLERPNTHINDSIHHGFIIEGISDYSKYRNMKKTWDSKTYTSYIEHCVKEELIYSYPEDSSNRCFNTGAIRWIDNRLEQKKIILKSYETYMNAETEKRQLVFLLDAMSLYLSKENF